MEAAIEFSPGVSIPVEALADRGLALDLDMGPEIVAALADRLPAGFAECGVGELESKILARLFVDTVTLVDRNRRSRAGIRFHPIRSGMKFDLSERDYPERIRELFESFKRLAIGDEAGPVDPSMQLVLRGYDRIEYRHSTGVLRLTKSF